MLVSVDLHEAVLKIFVPDPKGNKTVKILPAKALYQVRDIIGIFVMLSGVSGL